MKLASAISDGHHLYLDDLKRSLPNWGTTLKNLAKSYQENLPKIGNNLAALGEKIRLLESRNPTGKLTPFIHLGALLNAGGTAGPSYILQNNFEKGKAEIETAFKEIREVLRDQSANAGASTNSNAPTGLQPRSIRR
jgi:hypothetical protein